MVWAIITIYISKCAQMEPQQLLKTSNFYSRCKRCDIEKTLGGWVPSPLVARRLNHEKISMFDNRGHSKSKDFVSQFIRQISAYPCRRRAIGLGITQFEGAHMAWRLAYLTFRRRPFGPRTLIKVVSLY